MVREGGYRGDVYARIPVSAALFGKMRLGRTSKTGNRPRGTRVTKMRCPGVVAPVTSHDPKPEASLPQNLASYPPDLSTAPCAYDGKSARQQRKSTKSQARIDFGCLGRSGFLWRVTRLIRIGPSIGSLIARLGNERQRQHGRSEKAHHSQHPLLQLRTGNEIEQASLVYRAP